MVSKGGCASWVLCQPPMRDSSSATNRPAFAEKVIFHEAEVKDGVYSAALAAFAKPQAQQKMHYVAMKAASKHAAMLVETERQGIAFGYVAEENIDAKVMAHVAQETVKAKVQDFSINFKFGTKLDAILAIAIRMQSQANILMTPYGNIVGWGNVADDTKKVVEAAGTRVWMEHIAHAPKAAAAKEPLVEVTIARVDKAQMTAQEVKQIAEFLGFAKALKTMFVGLKAVVLFTEKNRPANIPEQVNGIWFIDCAAGSGGPSPSAVPPSQAVHDD